MRRLRVLAGLAACAAVASAVVPVIAPIGAVLGAQSPTDAATSARRSAAVRVMTVESPALDGRTWRYTVQMVSGARLLGAAAGTAAPSRALMLTVQLTDALAAGDQVVGTVRFTDGTSLVERPLRVQVPPRLMINVAVARALRTAQPGEVLFLPFTIANRGNSTDTLQLKVVTPSGWEASLTSVPLLVLASGSQATVTARVRPPVTLSAGSGLVALQATDASAVHGAGVLVEVGATRAASHLGPEMVMGVANVRDATGALQQAYSFALQGPVTDALRIDAALATPLSNDPLALRAAALLGAPMSGSRLRLSGTHGSAEVGRVGIRLPDLGGLGMGGDGVAIDWRTTSGAQVVAAAARQAGALGAGGPQGAVQWTSRPAPVTVQLGASTLDESESTGRRLDAFTVGARLAPSHTASFGVDVAERRFAGGRGLGMGADVSWDRPSTRGRVRVFHAPGGAAAFAMARDGAFFESQLHLRGGWQAAGQTWYTSDDAFDGTALKTTGGSFTPSRQIGASGEAGMTISFTRYETGAGPTRRADSEQLFAARMAFTVGALRWDAEAGEEHSIREARFAGQLVHEYGTRSLARTSVSLPSTMGTISVRGSFRTASTALASEGSVNIQVTDVHPIPGWRALTLDGGTQRMYLGTAGMSSAHAVLGVALPAGLRVLLGVQREALLASSTGAGNTSYSLRLERTSQAPGFARLSQRSGVVFLDLNDDGHRDRGEPGLPGVAVRLGGHTATTDGSGRYSLPVETGTLVIEARSLAEGQRVRPPDHAGSHDLPVRTTSRLDVHVRREEGFGKRNTIVAAIIVSARDSAGKEWMVTADEGGRAHFDALPAGDYVVSAASDRAEAPLRVEPVTVHITANASRAATVELVSRARPIRMQGGAAGGAGGSGSPSGSPSGTPSGTPGANHGARQ